MIIDRSPFLLEMLITARYGGINLYRCRILPHWWSDVCCAMLLLDLVCSFMRQNKEVEVGPQLLLGISGYMIIKQGFPSIT